MNEDKRIIELTATSELDATDFLPIDNSKSSSEENSGTRKIRVQTLLDSTLKVMLTQAEYDALPSSKLTDGKVYYITDESKIIINGVVYGAGGETVADVYENGVSVVDPTDKIARIKSYKEVTQAEYDALPSSKLTDDILYCIKDSEVSIVNDVRRNGTSIVNNGVADIAVDTTPTYNSTNLITSGGVSNAINPLQQQIGWLASAIEVELYNGSNTYNVGDYVWQNGSNSTIVLYKCIATTTGSWDSSKWEPVTVTSELEKKADKTYVDENIDKQLVHGTASGDIASFTDGADFPMKSLKVGIEPQQDLHGYDAPWVGGAGKNKYVAKYSGRTNNGITFSKSNDCVVINGKATNTAYYLSSSDEISIDYAITLSAGTYTLCKTPSSGINYTVKNTENYSFGYSSSTNSLTFTLSETTNIIINVRIYVDNVQYNNQILKIQVESGSTETTFAPYSNICPISGWSAVDVNVSGVNIWDEEWEVGAYNTNDGTKVAATDRIRSKNFIPIIPNSQYFVRLWLGATYSLRLFYYDKSYNFINSPEWIQQGVITTPNNAYYMTFILATIYGTTYNNDISINYPSSDTSYHAYNGQTYTIDLDGTRYGGKLDVVSGVLTVDRAEIDLGSRTYIKAVDGYFYAYISDLSIINFNANEPTAECEIYKLCTSAEWYGRTIDSGIFGIESSHVLYVADTRFSDGDSLKTALAGKKLVYTLATPTTIQLTPTQVKSLLGSNNVWCDTGKIEECEYIRDTNIVINKLLEAIEN